MFEFEWDPAKAASNLRKHGIDFELAATVLSDPLSRSIPDDKHGAFEERWITIGRARNNRLLVVCHTDADTGGRETSVRIISARPATRSEQREYEAGE